VRALIARLYAIPQSHLCLMLLEQFNEIVVRIRPRQDQRPTAGALQEIRFGAGSSFAGSHKAKVTQNQEAAALAAAITQAEGIPKDRGGLTDEFTCSIEEEFLKRSK